MNRHLLCTLLVIAALAVIPLHAQMPVKDISYSGNRFVDMCSFIDKPVDKWNATDVLNSGICQGYVIGFRDGVSLSIQMLKHNNNSLSYLKGSIEDLAICEPDHVEIGQIIKIMLKYIRDHPEQANLPTAELVILAEFNVYPCSVPTPTPAPKQ